MGNSAIAIVGGDLRQICMANLLAEKTGIGSGASCDLYGLFLDKEMEMSSRITATDDVRVLEYCNIVIFALPMADTGDQTVNAPFSIHKVPLRDCFGHVRPGALVLGGMVKEKTAQLASEYGLAIEDYFLREELAVLNAVPTAEGALEIAMRESPRTIAGSICMITGYGRIAKALAPLLLSLGAKVKVGARKHEDLAWSKVAGCQPVHLSQLGEQLSDVEILFNTVPAMILDKGILKKLPPQCLIIDLASKPGGVDFETAKALGLNVVWALSLPGKVAPITAGEILLDTIYHILEEKGFIIESD